MAFTGKYQMVSVEKNQEFLNNLGFSDEDFEEWMRGQTEIVQNGDDFTWSRSTQKQQKKITFKFTLNKECDMESTTGRKFRETARMAGGKLIIQFPTMLYVAEVSGDKLIERCTINGEDGITVKRISKRM